MGQQRQAEALASQALNLKPSWFHAYYARCRARVELGRLQEAYQDIVEAARLEPQNRVIKRYAARLSEEGVRLGLKLGMISSTSMSGGLHHQHHRRFGSSDSLGSASVCSEMTIREPPMPPPRTRPEQQLEKSPPFVGDRVKVPHRAPLTTSTNNHDQPRPRPRTNPFYSMASYKVEQQQQKQSSPLKKDETNQVASTFSYLSLDRDPNQPQKQNVLTGKPKQTDL